MKVVFDELILIGLYISASLSNIKLIFDNKRYVVYNPSYISEEIESRCGNGSMQEWYYLITSCLA